jgi:accessory colonization factor AcfC
VFSIAEAEPRRTKELRKQESNKGASKKTALSIFPCNRLYSRSNIIIFILGFILSMDALFSTDSAGTTLVVCGPGGPYPTIKECAEGFTDLYGIQVTVIKGEPHEQAPLVAQNCDVYYSGAEYMMREFMDSNPGVIDKASLINLAARRIGIIVRQGNPKHIRAVTDLAAPGVRILNVRLENMDDLRGPANHNVTLSVTTGEEGFSAWKSNLQLDAWVTYKTWSYQLQSCEFIPIEGIEGLRCTPVAVTRNARHPQAAMIRSLPSTWRQISWTWART